MESNKKSGVFYEKKVVFSLLSFLLIISCSFNESSFKSNSSYETGLNINGWNLISNEGVKSIQAETASNVLATKIEFSDELNENVQIDVYGNAESVLDRVQDPFFGISADKIDLADPEVIKFIESLESRSASEIDKSGTRSIRIVFSEVNTEKKLRQIFLGYNNNQSVYKEAGADLTYSQGWCFGTTSAGTLISDSTPKGQVDCTLYSRPVWGGSYSSVAHDNNIKYSDNQVNVYGTKFGWWNWKVKWHWDTDSRIIIGISW